MADMNTMPVGAPQPMPSAPPSMPSAPKAPPTCPPGQFPQIQPDGGFKCGGTAAPAPPLGQPASAGPKPIMPAPAPAPTAPSSPSASAQRAFNEVDSSKPLAWWQAQDKYLDPTATGYERYHSAKLDQNGNPIQGLFEHPDACPPGTLAFGQNQCLPVNDPRMVPYTHPGGPGTPGAPATPAGPGGDFQSFLEQQIRSLMGSPSAFSPDVMNTIEANALANARGSTHAAQQNLNDDLIARGMFSSPASAREAADIERGGMGQFNQAMSQAQIAKAQSDQQDKLAALDRAQKYLDSLRAAGVNEQQIQLGYAQIAAARENLMSQLGSNRQNLLDQLGLQRQLGTVPLGSDGSTVSINALPYLFGGL